MLHSSPSECSCGSLVTLVTRSGPCLWCSCPSARLSSRRCRRVPGQHRAGERSRRALSELSSITARFLCSLRGSSICRECSCSHHTRAASSSRPRVIYPTPYTLIRYFPPFVRWFLERFSPAPLKASEQGPDWWRTEMSAAWSLVRFSVLAFRRCPVRSPRSGEDRRRSGSSLPGAARAPRKASNAAADSSPRGTPVAIAGPAPRTHDRPGQR